MGFCFIAPDLVLSNFITFNPVAVDMIFGVIAVLRIAKCLKTDRIVNQAANLDHFIADVAFDLIAIVFEAFLEAIKGIGKG